MDDHVLVGTLRHVCTDSARSQHCVDGSEVRPVAAGGGDRLAHGGRTVRQVVVDGSQRNAVDVGLEAPPGGVDSIRVAFAMKVARESDAVSVSVRLGGRGDAVEHVTDTRPCVLVVGLHFMELEGSVDAYREVGKGVVPLAVCAAVSQQHRLSEDFGDARVDLGAFYECELVLRLVIDGLPGHHPAADVAGNVPGSPGVHLPQRLGVEPSRFELPFRHAPFPPRTGAKALRQEDRC
jgi:hypothetical protein